MKFWKANRGAVWRDDDHTAGRLAGIAGRGKAEGAFYVSAPMEETGRAELPERLFWTPHDLAEAQQ